MFTKVVLNFSVCWSCVFVNNNFDVVVVLFVGSASIFIEPISRVSDGTVTTSRATKSAGNTNIADILNIGLYSGLLPNDSACTMKTVQLMVIGAIITGYFIVGHNNNLELFRCLLIYIYNTSYRCGYSHSHVIQ